MTQLQILLAKRPYVWSVSGCFRPSLKRFLGLFLFLAGLLGYAQAATVIVEAPKLDKPSYPNAQATVSVIAVPPFRQSFGSDSFAGENFQYNGTTHELKVDNTPNESNIKHVWLHISYTDPGDHPNPPQVPGSVFDKSQNWPTISADGTITLTGAAVGHDNATGDDQVYLTWDIFPQPAEEVFDLDGLFNDPGGVRKVEVKTVCTPAPDGATGTGLLFLTALAGLGFIKQQIPIRGG